MTFYILSRMILASTGRLVTGGSRHRAVNVFIVDRPVGIIDVFKSCFEIPDDFALVKIIVDRSQQ